ncbi:MAG: restriction endonuclease [Nitrospirales bacterium]
MAKNQSKELELLVTKIQQVLAPHAEVTHDAKLLGRKSNRSRQIDVLVRDKIGQYDIMIVIDCKDYGRPVDVKGVEEFWGLVDDVGAHKGSLVCPKGFSQAAKERALGLQIDLYSPVDTDPHKWQVQATAPALCDFREARIGFGISQSDPLPFSIPRDFFSSLMVFDERKNSLDTMLKATMNRWNKGHFPIAPGIHCDLDIFDRDTTLIDNGYGQLTRVELKASLWVSKRTYFGQMPISKISGFKDEQTGAVITNAFTVGLASPDEVEKTWQLINEGEPLPSKPVLEVTGLVGYEDMP